MKPISFIASILIIVFLACSNNNRMRADRDNTVSVVMDSCCETLNPAYLQWCNIADSMIIQGKNCLPKKLSPLIEKGGVLNKEKLVYESLSPLYGIGDTIYFIEQINDRTANVYFLFWKKNEERSLSFDNVFFYRFQRYQQGISWPESEECMDSVFIRNNLEESSYPKYLLSVCNRWDTKLLNSESSWDENLGTHYNLAFRIILLDAERFTIECVGVVNNQRGETTYPYEVIYEK